MRRFETRRLVPLTSDNDLQIIIRCHSYSIDWSSVVGVLIAKRFLQEYGIKLIEDVMWRSITELRSREEEKRDGSWRCYPRSPGVGDSLVPITSLSDWDKTIIMIPDTYQYFKQGRKEGTVHTRRLHIISRPAANHFDQSCSASIDVGGTEYFLEIIIIPEFSLLQRRSLCLGVSCCETSAIEVQACAKSPRLHPMCP